MFNILLVEDSSTQAARIKLILEHAGLAVSMASNGREAIEVLESHCPDAVVTDLQMPEMNGLGLISQMGIQYPLIPTVLITKHGSERLAVDALSIGAASYVPKSHLHVLLPEVVTLVANLAVANYASLPLKSTMETSRLSYTLDARIARIEPLACLILRQLTAIDVLHSLDRIRMCVALEYLMYQALFHGNLEQPFSSEPISRADAAQSVEQQSHDEEFRKRLGRRVTCDVQVDDYEIQFYISHDGPGRMIAPTSALPGTPKSFEDENARGMLLLTSVMDQVVFGRDGSSATLTKKL